MRIAFLGTPEFALPTLAALIARGDSLCVFT
jgi:methionyl-tRNA formyltransferase